MKAILFAAALAAAATPAFAQAVTQGEMCAKAPVMPTPTGSAENRMLSDDTEAMAKVTVSKQIIKPEQAMAAGQVILRAGTLHHAAVEYRRSPTPASLHTRMAEFFYVLDGEADLILGGTLTNPKCVNSSNLAGDGVAGGVTHHVKKGSYIMVPENTAHYFTNIDKANGMTVLDLHVPTPAADQF
jgi:oxalate decarboxylase/phosphoglucose isomerase-like protein (cupin superfamily)